MEITASSSLLTVNGLRGAKSEHAKEEFFQIMKFQIEMNVKVDVSCNGYDGCSRHYFI